MSTANGRGADRENVAGLERGLLIIQAFDAEHAEMTLSEVAAATGFAPATARRCLLTLQRLGYVGVNGRRFLLRPRILTLGAAFLRSMHLETIAQPYLQEIVDRVGDGSSLAVLEGHDILYLIHVATRRMMRLTVSAGTRFPAYATALGRIQLAYRGEGALDLYLATARFTALTEHTVTDPSCLRAILVEARANGFSAVRDELDYGITSVAVPIVDAGGAVIAAINCSASSGRISREELVATRLPLLRETAALIAGELRQYPALVHSVTSPPRV
jgi:IclR family transcriptional regulator, pca regulon regulatory protein